MNFKILLYFISMIIISIFQTVFTNYIRIQGVTPDFFLVFIVCNTLIFEMIESAFIGIVFGLMVDALFAKITGFSSLFFMYVALSAGLFNKKIYKDSILPAVFFVGITTLIYNLYYIFIMFALKGNPIYWSIILKTTIIQIVYNMCITFIVHPFVLRMNEWLKISSKITRKY